MTFSAGRHRFSSFSPNLQGAKVATQRNAATFTEIVAVGAPGAFVFFQLLRTIGNSEFLDLFIHYYRGRMAEEGGFEPPVRVYPVRQFSKLLV